MNLKQRFKEIFILSSEKINDRYVANKILRRKTRTVNYSLRTVSNARGDSHRCTS